MTVFDGEDGPCCRGGRSAPHHPTRQQLLRATAPARPSPVQFTGLPHPSLPPPAIGRPRRTIGAWGEPQPAVSRPASSANDPTAHDAVRHGKPKLLTPYQPTTSKTPTPLPRHLNAILEPRTAPSSEGQRGAPRRRGQRSFGYAVRAHRRPRLKK